MELLLLVILLALIMFGIPKLWNMSLMSDDVSRKNLIRLTLLIGVVILALITYRVLLNTLWFAKETIVPGINIITIWMLIWFGIPSLWLSTINISNKRLKVVCRAILIIFAVISALVFFIFCFGVGELGCM